MEPSELREELARAEEALSELEFSKQMRDEEYKALSHHSEALASELRRTRADLATARAAISRQTSVAKEATMLEDTLSSQVSQATNAKLAAAQEYRDAIEAHDAQVRRVVHELKNERERSTRLECELDEVREHWQKAHAKIQTLEEALQENLRIFEVWKQKEKKWRQERQALQQQKERHAQTLLFRKEELEHTRRELMRENQRLRSGLEGRRSPGKASRRSRSSRGLALALL
ncbi:hypothetical protein AB1Y20_002290 [Prymnesium parvum]|uniref:Uncharacterized protein n=1 Tax=Prymnesium parvum TaxID=97485 RepID=A0AB34JAN7_PRYPA